MGKAIRERKRKERADKQVPMDQLPLETRLRATVYNKEDCNAAFHGNRVFPALGGEATRLCMIHGIRHHYGFAQKLRGAIPEFTRALNARDIMSSVIPDMNKPEEIPYCIWHPDVPSDDALRALVQRYPHLVYHAARACAIAGFVNLYEELDVLPEVHVAEEASHASAERKTEGSQAIYQLIVSQPVKYAVFNDYTRTVDIQNPRVAICNGDTAVYSSIRAWRGHKKHIDFADGWFWSRYTYGTSHYFDITEDWGISDHDCNDHSCGIDDCAACVSEDHDCHEPRAPADDVPLLYSPLPVDLPPINKDKLILVAAYTGDIDRYTRLQRPQMILYEFDCVIRGIYHNVF